MIIFESCSLNGKLPLTDFIFPLLLVLLYGKQNVFILLKNKFSKRLLIDIVLLLLIALVNYFIIGDTRTFSSQIRLIVNSFVMLFTTTYFIKYTNEIDKFINAYELFCFACSLCVVLQFILVYLFGIVLQIDFGQYQLSQNWASAYNEINDGYRLYRTGGFFNEPSWFAIFISPALFISAKRNHFIVLLTCIIGLLFSTSNLGFAFILLFFLLKIRKISHVLVLILLIVVIYLSFPQIFSRFIEQFIIEKSIGSGAERLIDPLDLLNKINALSLFGIDISEFRTRIFIGTFMYVLLTFGVVGLAIFLNIIYVKNYIGLSLIFITTVVIDGCYGRIDFWMVLCVSHLLSFQYSIKKNEKYYLCKRK